MLVAEVRLPCCSYVGTSLSREALTMSKAADRESSDNSGAPEGAPDLFQDFIEARYAEWEDEFGEGVEARRTASFDPRY
jgi:hypothetical protein